MAFPVVVPLAVALALGLFAFSGDSSAAAPVNGGGGGVGPKPGDIEALTCEQAAGQLPPALVAQVQGIAQGPKTSANAAAATALAKSLDALSTSPATAPQYRMPMQVTARCLRDYAAAVSSGNGGTPVPPPSPTQCADTIANLPPAYQTPVAMMLANAPTASNAQAARDYATTLDALALVTGGAQGAAFKAAAGCLRQYAAAIDGGAGAGGGTGGGPAPAPTNPKFPNLNDPFGVPASCDGGPRKAGVATNPKYEWREIVRPGDSAFAIATRVFGQSGATWQRVIELIRLNPREVFSGRYLGEKGDAANPNKTQFNWQYPILAGDRLRVPLTWNPWIDQMGNNRGQSAPFPPC